MRRVGITAALMVCLLVVASHCPGAEAKKKKKEIARAVKSDLKYVKCQVCQELAKNLNREANALRDAKGSKLTEADVLEKVEKMCDVETEEGEWLIKHDLQEKGAELKMVYMDGKFGACNSECKTMQRACEDIVGDRDTDVAEAIFTDPTMKRAALQAFLCNDAASTKACAKKPPPLPADRAPGPAFEEKTEKDIQMQRMMKQMKAMGMGGTMYNRDDMDDLMDDYRDDYGDLPDGLNLGGDATAASDDAQTTSDDAPVPSLMDKVKAAGRSAWNWGKGLFGGSGAAANPQTNAPETHAPPPTDEADEAPQVEPQVTAPKKSKKKSKKSKKKKAAKAAGDGGEL